MIEMLKVLAGLGVFEAGAWLFRLVKDNDMVYDGRDLILLVAAFVFSFILMGGGLTMLVFL